MNLKVRLDRRIKPFNGKVILELGADAKDSSKSSTLEYTMTSCHGGARGETFRPRNRINNPAIIRFAGDPSSPTGWSV
jgi:hypothetical protein